MCLPSRCLAINVYYDFAIQAFGRHITVFNNVQEGLTCEAVFTRAGQITTAL
jgi:hypothetical protein